MKIIWPYYRVVFEDLVKLDGADEMSIDDLDEACEALDAWEDARPRGKE